MSNIYSNMSPSGSRRFAPSLHPGSIQSSSTPTPARCKPIPGPSFLAPEASWAHSNEPIDKRMLQPTPAGAVRHPRWPVFTVNERAKVNASCSTFEFHTSGPGSVDWNQWHGANDTCLPWANYRCSSDGYHKVVISIETWAGYFMMVLSF